MTSHITVIEQKDILDVIDEFSSLFQSGFSVTVHSGAPNTPTDATLFFDSTLPVKLIHLRDSVAQEILVPTRSGLSQPFASSVKHKYF